MDMITTQQALQLIKLLGAMNIKQNFVDMIKETSKLEKERTIVMKKLLKKKPDDEEITDELVTKLFDENIELAKEYAEIQLKLEELGANLLLDFIFALGNNEEIFYKTMANIFGKKEKDIKNEDVTETVNKIIDIFKSPQFMGFFNVLKK